MRTLIFMSILGFAALGCRADDDAPAPPLPASGGTATAPAGTPAPGPAAPAPGLVPEPAWSPRPARARPSAPIVAATEPAADNHEQVRFASEAKWDLAGYNNDEVIYTIFITSHDSRIIRCTTELKGSYYENGEKHSVSDRQSTTVFPEQRVQAGNWQGMDQKSGAVYSVKCHPA